MTYLDLVLSCVYQGLALVLPFSGNTLILRLFPWFADPAIGPILNAIIDVGTALALMVILHKEIHAMGRGAWAVLKHRRDGSPRLLLALALGALPLLVLDNLSLSPIAIPGWMVGALVLVVGALLFLADKLGVTIRDVEHVSVVNYLIIGVLAAAGGYAGLAPQITVIIVARIMGCERDQAARLAFLLVIPHLLTGMGGFFGDAASPPWGETLLVGAMTFSIAGVGACLLLGWLRRHSFAAMAVLQTIVGAVLVLAR